MGLSNLLELGLDLLNGVVFEVLDFLESAPDHAQGLRVDPGCREDLVNLSILSFEGLLDGLKLLLEDKVP